MNQLSRQTRQRRRAPKKNIFHRVVISWAVVGAVALGIGIGAGMVLANKAQAESIPTQPGFVAMRTVPMKADLQKQVYETAEEYGIDWTLLMAVIQKESRYDAYAVSGSGDYGLMQINRVNHAQLSVETGVHDFLDPKENVRAGAYMLSQLINRYQDVHMALMAYNMGEAGAAEWWNQGVYTSAYSREVISIQRELKRANYGTMA